MTAEEIIELIWKKHSSLIVEAEKRYQAGYKRDAIILYRIAKALSNYIMILVEIVKTKKKKEC